jgi:hypothetical protein
MEEWVEANRISQPAAADAVAFWARQLRREIPADGTLAAAKAEQRAEQLAEQQRADTERTIAETKQTIAETMAALRASQRHRKRSLAQFDHKINQMLAENWARRLAYRRPVRWLRRTAPGGRFLLYWLTIIAGMVALGAWAGLLILLSWAIERVTGSAFLGAVAILLLASLGLSAWAYGHWSHTMTRRLMAWLQQLEEQR